MTTKPITQFKGKWEPLSNFSPTPIKDGQGREWPTAEHYFQSLKTDDPEEQMAILLAPTPAAAKARGKKVTLRAGWDEERIARMMGVLQMKFRQNEAAKFTLLATGDAELIEGNVWNDRFWGVCKGTGQNHLGRLLMALRAQLQTG